MPSGEHLPHQRHQRRAAHLRHVELLYARVLAKGLPEGAALISPQCSYLKALGGMGQTMDPCATPHCGLSIMREACS